MCKIYMKKCILSSLGDTKGNLGRTEGYIMFLDFKELNFINMHSFLN